MGDRYVPAGDREDAILQNRSQPLLFARNRILSRTVAWGRLEEVAHTRAVGKSGANKEKSQNGTVTTAGQVLFGLARPVHHLDWRGALKRLHFSLLLLTSLCTRSLENRRSHQQSPRTLGACNKG